MTQQLAGKRVLVTGAGTGIGREIALEMARQGADVALHYAHSDTGARSAVTEILSLGQRAEAFQANFADVAAVQGLAEEAISFLGGVDCLINNAGITFNRPFGKVTPEQFDCLYQVNVRAQFFLTQRIVEDMLPRQAGVICNITSIHALAGVPEHALYAGTKGAIVAYTRALAVELAHRGIRVNALAPGWVTVENYAKALPVYDEATLQQTAYERVPVARYGLPRDIAKVTAFLCSDDAGYIVGQTITVDGGTTAMMSLVTDFRQESGETFGAGYMPGM